MDNLTHTLFGATLARTSLGRAGRGTTAALILGSNGPDLDVAAVLGGTLGYLDWHRGPTHGPFGVLLIGALSGAVVWSVLRWRDARHPPSRHERPAAPLHMLALLGMLGTALHIAMDLPTSYGTRFLSPFTSDWFTADWMPIIDVYLLAILGAGLIIGRTTGARHAVALGVILLMAANYGVRGVAHHQAVARAPQAFGPRLPGPCDGSKVGPAMLSRWTQMPRVPEPATAQARCLLEVAAIPTFLSPFRWQLIARTTNAYELQSIDLVRDGGAGARPWRLSRRVPDQWTPAVRHAAASHVGRRFLSFARFPAARSVLEDDGSTTVRWRDMRFAPGPSTPRTSPDRRNLFGATVRVGADGQILEQRLGD